jgi:hypothetical protein
VISLFFGDIRRAPSGPMAKIKHVVADGNVNTVFYSTQDCILGKKTKNTNGFSGSVGSKKKERPRGSLLGVPEKEG